MRRRIAGTIRDLPEEERLQLVALAWLGRGTYDLSEWRTALDTARMSAPQAHCRVSALGLPLLGDYLEDGFAFFDEGIVDDTDTQEGVDEETGRWATCRTDQSVFNAFGLEPGFHP